MGSLIPDWAWDWNRHWPIALAGVIITLLVIAILTAIVLIW